MKNVMIFSMVSEKKKCFWNFKEITNYNSILKVNENNPLSLFSKILE